MSRKKSPPRYLRHKSTGQAYTRIDGRMIYLGSFDSPESRAKYADIVSDWSAGNLDKYGQSVSVARLAVAFTKHAQVYYRKDGKETSEVSRIRSAMRTLVSICGSLSAEKFSPKHLERVREKFLDSGLSRESINSYTSIIVRAFRYGVVEGCVPAQIWQSLRALPGLRKGRTQAKESKPVLPVPPVDVLKTLRECGPIVAAMARLQYLTGMRPSEVCRMRVKDLVRKGEIWRYRPESHKAEHHGRTRVVLLGRKAQRVLTPFLDRTQDSFVFSPDDPGKKSAQAGAERMHYATSYDRTSYRRAINRAAKRAGVNEWTPNQLRHTYATIVRRRFGLEAAQILLGHSKADVTQVYAERDFTKAEEAVRECG